MAYRDDIEALGASLIFILDSVDGVTDVVLGNVFGTSSGTDTSTAALCEDAANAGRTTGRTDRMTVNTSTGDTDDMMFASARLALCGWFSTSTIQQPTCRIMGVNNAAGTVSMAIMLGFGNTVTFEVDDTFNVQIYSDTPLVADREYHFCLIFEGNGFGNEVRAYIDGVEMTAAQPTDRVPDVATLAVRTICQWGDPAGTVQMGSDNFVMVAPVNGRYNTWAFFIDAAAVLTDTEVRDILFEKGAVPTTTIAAGTEAVMQTALDGLASSVRVNAPLCIRVAAVTGDGDVELTADDVTFDPLASIHVQYMGTGTLTWINSNGGNALIGSTPNGGTIIFITQKTLTITVKDDSTLTAVEGARVSLYAAAGPAVLNTSLMSVLTNVSGVATLTTFQYSADQPYTGNVRKGAAAPYYKSKEDVSGTITTDGLDIVVLITPDT